VSQSEIARLLQEIEETFLAVQNAMTGFSSRGATHNFISKKMENMNGIRASLSKIVGPDQAMQLIAERLDNI